MVTFFCGTVLSKGCYSDFGPPLAGEKLRERHEVKLSVETVRKLMTAAGLWVPRAWRATPVHQPRTRRPCRGELVQIDGGEQAWVEERAPVCPLLVYVDDATRRILIARLVGSESTTSYRATTREDVERHGKPLAFYSDRHAGCTVKRRDSLNGEGITPCCRALQQRGIELICATSSPAKGRVERAHLTRQDRLVKELRLQGISTIEGANHFLGPFIDDYNHRFGKDARNPIDGHRPVGQRERLDDIFSVQEKRQLSRNLTFRHDNTVYAIEPTAENLKLKNKTVTVLTQLDGTMRVRYRNTERRFVKDFSRPSRKAPPKHASHKDLTEIINRLFPDPERVIDLAIESDSPECEHDTVRHF